MATPYFPCPDAGDVWSSCVFSQMLGSFDTTLRQALTGGLLGTSLQMLQILGAMEIILLCGWMMLYHDGDQYLAHLFVQGVRLGICAQLLGEFWDLSMLFADGWIQIAILFGQPASTALGLPPFTLAQFHDPGSILLVGWRLFTPLFDYIENLGLLGAVWHTATIILYGIVAIGGWACVLWIGLNIIVGWIELMLLVLFGIATFPFLMFEYTSFIAAGMLSTVAAACIRMGVLAALLSIIFPVMRSLQVTDGTDPGWDTVLALLGMMLLFGYLSYRAHALAAMVSGGSAAYTGSGLVFMATQAKTMAQQVPVVGSTISNGMRQASGHVSSRINRMYS